MRFIPNSAQRQMYVDSHNRDIILKARQLGFTTFEMISSLDECLFIPDLAAGCIAHAMDDAKDIFRNKIKYAYENIDNHWLVIFNKMGWVFPTPKNDKGEGYVFSNGSSITVGTSFRGGTLQRLHVSEFGKICKKYPEKAEEIISGAFEALDASCRITVESTAEGREGRFFDYCKEAEDLQRSKTPLTPLDFNFHFFPWWQNPEYELSKENTQKVTITKEDNQYFESLEKQIQLVLSPGQKAWYVKKETILKDKMKREYPGTSKEAFEQAISGAYYADQMAEVRKESQIRAIPYDPRMPVHVFFDLGRNDSMTMWFMQHHYSEYRFIRYHEDSGYSIQHYLKYMQSLGYVYGDIYLPHDAAIVDLTQADNLSRADVVRSAGFNVVVVPRVPDKMDAIQAVRDILPMCWFDEKLSALGVTHLDNYHKEWDDKNGVWKERPRHDAASHGNDAFEQFARGYREATRGQESFEPDWEV